MQSTISGEIFKQTAFGTSVCIPLALFIGVRAKKHGVIGTMINGNPEAVWAQRKEPLTQLWDVLYNLAPFTTPSHCATPLWHQCSKVFAHATSSICFMLQALLPFSTWQTPTHPTRFTLNFHFLSKAFPSPLGRVGHMLLQAPTASCSSPTSLNHCVCLLSCCLWEYDWGGHLCFCYPAHFSSCYWEQYSKLPLGHHPIPTLSPLLDNLFQITLDSGVAIGPNSG